MTIDQQLKDKINKALGLNKLDTRLSYDFMKILDEKENSLALESTVSYFAVGTPQNSPNGMKKSTTLPEVYTAKTTYGELLDYVENKDFRSFEKSTQYQPLEEE